MLTLYVQTITEMTAVLIMPESNVSRLFLRFSLRDVVSLGCLHCITNITRNASESDNTSYLEGLSCIFYTLYIHILETPVHLVGLIHQCS